MAQAAMESFIAALLDGDTVAAVARAQTLRDSGASLEAVVREGIEPAMNNLDARCTLEQFNLLEIMLVGRAVAEVMRYLFPSGPSATVTRGTVVLASPEGDVHDLGKNILKMVLTGKAWEVVDCGRDCPLDRLIDMAAQVSPVAVGVSGLITPVIPAVRQIRGLLQARGLGQVKVIAGGAALKQATAESLQVDFVAESAFDGAAYLDSLVAGGVRP